MTSKTLTQILDEHQSRMEHVGQLVWDAREILLNRKNRNEEDQRLLTILQSIKYGLGGSPIDIDSRPLADALDFFNANVCLELEWSDIDGWADDCQWRVRARHGSPNDREWTTIAVAPTVEAALIKTAKVGKV